MEKRKLLGVVVIILILAVVFFMYGNKEKDKDVQVQKHTEELKEELQEEEQESRELLSKEPEQTEEKPEVPPVIELKGLNEEMLQVLGAEKEALAEALNEWAKGNGLSSIEGASFYPRMNIDFMESKYSMEFVVILGDKGNGIYSDADREHIYTMDYYKQNETFNFH